MGFRYFSSLSGERDKYITLRKDRFPKCKQSGRDAGGRRGLGGGGQTPSAKLFWSLPRLCSWQAFYKQVRFPAPPLPTPLLGRNQGDQDSPGITSTLMNQVTWRELGAGTWNEVQGLVLLPPAILFLFKIWVKKRWSISVPKVPTLNPVSSGWKEG